MKKTLIVTIDFPPRIGGVASYWQKVTSSLPPEKITVLSAVPFFKYFYPRWLKGCYKIWRVYRQNNCEQIWADQVLPIGTMVFFLHKIFKIPYFIQVHGLDLLLAKAQPRKFKLAKKILAQAQLVFCNSQAVGQILQKDFLVTSYQVIYPQSNLGTDIDVETVKRIKQQYNLTGKKIILTVGRLVPRKGQDLVIKALPAVLAKHPNTVYVIVGSGPDAKRLQTLARDLSGQVLFVGAVAAAQELRAWYSLAEVFIMPARLEPHDIEGFGIVYLEANSFKKPVIAGNVGSSTEAVEAGVSGLLVDSLNVQEISQALLKLLDNPQLAQQLGEQGYQRWQNKFVWSKSVEIIKQRLL